MKSLYIVTYVKKSGKNINYYPKFYSLVNAHNQKEANKIVQRAVYYENPDRNSQFYPFYIESKRADKVDMDIFKSGKYHYLEI